jgi:hypothetical protein
MQRCLGRTSLVCHYTLDYHHCGAGQHCCDWQVARAEMLVVLDRSTQALVFERDTKTKESSPSARTPIGVRTKSSESSPGVSATVEGAVAIDGIVSAESRSPGDRRTRNEQMTDNLFSSLRMLPGNAGSVVPMVPGGDDFSPQLLTSDRLEAEKQVAALRAYSRTGFRYDMGTSEVPQC